MIEIKLEENPKEEYFMKLDSEFNKYAENNGVVCNYIPFTFVAKDNDKFIGMITGHSYYKEVVIRDLIVIKEYRNKKIGSKLVYTVEEYFKNKGFENINLTTYEFEAPLFYKKCGFNVEFKRENKDNQKLTKYFLIKHFNK